MNTAVIGRFKGVWYVFAEWETQVLISRANQVMVLKAIKKASDDHPDIPIFHYVVTKKILLVGDTFSYAEWDNIVISSQVHYNEYPQQWDTLNYYDVIAASKEAKGQLL